MNAIRILALLPLLAAASPRLAIGASAHSCQPEGFQWSEGGSGPGRLCFECKNDWPTNIDCPSVALPNSGPPGSTATCFLEGRRHLSGDGPNLVIMACQGGHIIEVGPAPRPTGGDLPALADPTTPPAETLVVGEPLPEIKVSFAPPRLVMFVRPNDVQYAGDWAYVGSGMGGILRFHAKTGQFQFFHAVTQERDYQPDRGLWVATNGTHFWGSVGANLAVSKKWAVFEIEGTGGVFLPSRTLDDGGSCGLVCANALPPYGQAAQILRIDGPTMEYAGQAAVSWGRFGQPIIKGDRAYFPSSANTYDVVDLSRPADPETLEFPVVARGVAKPAEDPHQTGIGGYRYRYSMLNLDGVSWDDAWRRNMREYTFHRYAWSSAEPPRCENNPNISPIGDGMGSCVCDAGKSEPCPGGAPAATKSEAPALPPAVRPPLPVAAGTVHAAGGPIGAPGSPVVDSLRLVSAGGGLALEGGPDLAAPGIGGAGESLRDGYFSVAAGRAPVLAAGGPARVTRVVAPRAIDAPAASRIDAEADSISECAPQTPIGGSIYGPGARNVSQLTPFSRRLLKEYDALSGRVHEGDEDFGEGRPACLSLGAHLAYVMDLRLPQLALACGKPDWAQTGLAFTWEGLAESGEALARCGLGALQGACPDCAHR